MRIGLGLSLASVGGPFTFNPATLGLSGWWKASFSGSPWVDQIAGGNSNLTDAVNAPAVGTAVNGLTPASFNGTSSHLVTLANTNTFYNSASAYAVCALINVTAFTATDPGPTGPFAIPQMLADNSSGGPPCGGVAGSGSSGVFRFGHHNGSAWNSSNTAITTGTWTMVAAWYDGVNIQASKNAGSVTSVAHSTGSAAPGFLFYGTNGFGFPNVQVLEGMTRKTPWTSTELANIKSYFNARFALSL